MSAIDRVRRVLAAGARIADASDELGIEARARLPRASGLSKEGIELALTEHLERTASDSETERFVALAGRSARCHVVLSANVCTGALRAIAFGVATSPHTIVRPSRRDPVVADLVVRALSADAAFALADGAAAMVSEIDVEPADELHVYGTDETVQDYARRAQGAVIRGHGAGFGVAIVGALAAVEDAAAALARDVVPFDQRGCLSPRIAFVAGGAARVEHYAHALDGELERLGQSVPRGQVDEATQRELALYRASVESVGLFLDGRQHGVGVDLSPRALVLPPAARVVHVVAADHVRARALLDPLSRYVTIVGTAGAETDVLQGFACRVTELGSMQRPPFDGPVDLRPYRASQRSPG